MARGDSRAPTRSGLSTSMSGAATLGFPLISSWKNKEPSGAHAADAPPRTLFPRSTTQIRALRSISV